MNKKAKNTIFATITISLILFLFLTSYFVLAEEPQPEEPTITRTAYTTKTCYPDGHCIIYESKGQINYYNGSEYLPINKTIVSSSDPSFDHEVTKGIYQAYFKSNPTQGQVVKFIANNSEITFQPMALNYRNDLSMIQQISMIQNVVGIPSGSEFLYENAYGSGIDLQYKYTNRHLKENLIIDSFTDLISPAQYIIDGGNPTLDLDFVLATDSNHIVIEGVDWDKSTTKETSNEVYIKDDEGNILYYFRKPYAYDSNLSLQSLQLLKYQFKKSANKLYIILKTPYSWLSNESRVYPVYIDPPIWTYQEDANATDCGDNPWHPTYPCANTYDGDWDTFGDQWSNQVTMFFNYTKLAGAKTSSLLKVKDEEGTANLSIPSACWGQNPLQFRVDSVSWMTAPPGLGGQVCWNCWQGSTDKWTSTTGWNGCDLSKGTPLRYTNLTYTYIFEEAMWWDVDLTFPLISIDSPANNTNTTDTSLNITYIYVEENPDVCWWNDGDGANTTLASCGTNITTVNWTEGNHNVTIFINDTASNFNSTTVFFLVDSVSPTITIDHPKPQNYETNESLSLNYTVSDSGVGIDSCWYKVINSTSDLIIDNITITSCVNITFNISQGGGIYNLTLYSNDTFNNLNSSEVEFGISLIGPAIVLDAPIDDQYSNNGTYTYFNFTATDTDGLDTCQLWHNATGTWHKNYSWVGPTSDTQNYTTVNISEGTSIWNVWCNDTLNDKGWALHNFTFTVDKTDPNVTIITVNGTTVSDTLSITIDYNISDTNIDSCYFTLRTSGGLLHNYPENTSLSCSSSRSISTLFYGTFVFQLWGEDSAGNLDYANLTFTTRETPSASAGGGGTSMEEEEPEVEKTFCGDGICQSEGNDYGIKENFWNCNIDCLGFNFDEFIWSFTKYCFDGDPSTVCAFTQLFATAPMEGFNVTVAVCGDGVCEPSENVFGCPDDCGKFSEKTLFFQCLDNDPATPCFWSSNLSYILIFFGGTGILLVSVAKIKFPGEKKKMSPYGYVVKKWGKKKGRR